jgi:Zn-dependent membrane protease YugP
MVNLLISVLLSGIAVTFTIELLSLGLGLFIDKERIYSVLSLPLSFGALICFYSVTKEFIVAVPAIAFVALVLNKMVNKPVVFNASRRNAQRL